MAKYVEVNLHEEKLSPRDRCAFEQAFQWSRSYLGKKADEGRPMLVPQDQLYRYVKGLAWYKLGVEGSIDERTCYENSLQYWPEHSSAWYNLGCSGGGTAGGMSYDKRTCFEKALEFDPLYAKAWHALAVAGGGTVQGKKYDNRACCMQVLKIRYPLPDAYFKEMSFPEMWRLAFRVAEANDA